MSGPETPSKAPSIHWESGSITVRDVQDLARGAVVDLRVNDTVVLTDHPLLTTWAEHAIQVPAGVFREGANVLEWRAADEVTVAWDVLEIDAPSNRPPALAVWGGSKSGSVVRMRVFPATPQGANLRANRTRSRRPVSGRGAAS